VRPGNYAEQAASYDRTRSASTTVVRVVAKHLGPRDSEGRRLLDIAGGTGNYGQVFAARGYRVTVVDAEPAMLERAAAKLGPDRSVAGDAQSLPFRDETFDRALILSAIHLFDDPTTAFREAHRILREGPLVVMAFTTENLVPLFVYDYFGGASPEEIRHGREDVASMLREAGFSRVEAETFIYVDTADGSLVALHTDPYRLAGPAYLRNTSFWHRIDEETRRAGLEALERDLRSGVLQRRVDESMRLAVRYGHGTVFAARP
jgi:ubiquinone/menaquinone biosynthesis C-methylase UbiE